MKIIQESSRLPVSHWMLLYELITDAIDLVELSQNQEYRDTPSNRTKVYDYVRTSEDFIDYDWNNDSTFIEAFNEAYNDIMMQMRTSSNKSNVSRVTDNDDLEDIIEVESFSSSGATQSSNICNGSKRDSIDMFPVTRKRKQRNINNERN